MKINGKASRTIWLAPRRLVGRDHRPDAAAARARSSSRCSRPRGRGARHPRHAGARRAADRRHGGLRRLPGPARRTPPTTALDRGDRVPRRAAPDRHQPALGAGRDARAPCATCRASSASPPPTQRAAEIGDEDVETCRRIGEHGLALIEAIAAQARPGEPVNILTHCNAGWLACVDWGTATVADLPGARRRHAAACLGRRDAAAQPGRLADRLRARQPRRAAHRRSSTTPAAT